MAESSKSSLTAVLIAAAVVLASAGVVVLVISIDRTGRKGDRLGERFKLDPAGVRKIDPALVSHELARTFETNLDSARGLAVDARGRIYVAGAQAVGVFDADGKPLERFELSRPGHCLAVGPDGRIYVGVGDRVDVLDAKGTVLWHWPAPDDGGAITSIAVSDEGVFVANYTSRIVYRYDASGNRMNEIISDIKGGEPELFTMYSPYLDVAIGLGGEIVVVNPGKHRIETYTPKGKFRSVWGSQSNQVEGFAGCCNPSHIAILPDGRVVTSEKGAQTIKIHTLAGEVESVVATAEMLARIPKQCANPYHATGLDIAVAPDGRILVLDPGGRVGVFTRKKTQ